MASSEKYSRKDKNQNIQVFVRLRPLNQRERGIRSLGVVDVVNNREVTVRQSQQTSHTKKFTFDRAFGPATEQVEVYKDVVSPLIAEVLAGYNCTVFAYGQTGTGKTHTMVGESSGEGTTWQNDPLAGIIPRALSQLFDELRITNTEYTVRVSYLELYNEELFDLLATSEDNSKLRIYEDVTKKGSTIVNGLEEITVYNKNEVYEIMSRGQERKRVASTLMNAQSSRSHTVFTIVVHMKENCPKGEELVKIGKLNLVDLAGSENISKAGSDNPAKKERARECVNINQSLLTLGRVITALVEKHPHIPYRESKLTRILQESLGGRTKTSIIATISPGHKDLEETMSTLEYAHRAKNIQNKPEVNQKLTKQAILKDFAEEIDKLKRELTANRDKHGVYLPTETYEEMTIKQDEQRREIQELLLKKRSMEEERARMEQVFAEMDDHKKNIEGELASTKADLETTNVKLVETSTQRAEQAALVAAHARTERQLSAQARALLRTADLAAGDVQQLQEAVDKRKTVESTNQEVVSAYRAEASLLRAAAAKALDDGKANVHAVRTDMQGAIDDQTRDATMAHENNIQDVKLLIGQLNNFMNEINSTTEETNSNISNAAQSWKAEAESAEQARRCALKNLVTALRTAAAAAANAAASVDVVGAVGSSTDQWVKHAKDRLSCLQRTRNFHSTGVCALEARRLDGARAHHKDRLARAKNAHQAMRETVAQLEKDKQAIEARIADGLSLITYERSAAEERLQRWADAERRSLEDRLAQYMEAERAALDQSLEKYTKLLEEHKAQVAELTEKIAEAQQRTTAAREEEECAGAEYLKQCEKEHQESLRALDSFGKDFDEGTTAIEAEVSAFSESLREIVSHSHDQLMDKLNAAQATVEDEAKSAEATVEKVSQESARATEIAAAGLVECARNGLAVVVDKTRERTLCSSTTLEAVSKRSEQASSSAMNGQNTLNSYVARASNAVTDMAAGAHTALQQHADIENRYLMNEYRLYEPSGNTPARRQFRYPRQLAATSPHDRLLARLRARPQHSPDSDCVVLESDEERHTSDSESSVSEDSAVAMQ